VDLSVLDRLGAIAVLTDRDGAILEWTRGFGELELRLPEQLRGAPMWELAAPDERDRVKAAIVEVGSGRTARRLDVAMLGSSDRRMAWSFTSSGADAIIAWGTDVASPRDAGMRNAEFLATLSHELRNPLASIRNTLAVLDAASDLRGNRARMILERQVAHLSRIVDDLLDTARVASGKTQLHRQPLALAALIWSTIDDHRSRFEAKGIACISEVTDEELWVDGDATRLVQMVGNLLTNALKFTPRGGRVTIVLERDGESAVLRIRDTGVGIEPGLNAQLFEPFVQADQALDRAAGGLGLGLALSKGLVELHGGTIAAASRGVNAGTELTVRLPLVPRPARVERTSARGSAPARRVLVIEDNIDVAESLRSLLELRGHRVRTSYDGTSGIAAAREFKPEVILCDLGLPGVSGYDVARSLRVDEASAPRPVLVALSGYTQPEDRARSAEAGFQHHLAKPLDLGDLESVLAGVTPCDRATARST
jgi:two-component system CheB/CheR fusion protein